MKKFFLIFVLFSTGFAFHSHIPVLGPNIEVGMLSMAAPAGLRGAFVPEFNANFAFEWFEPLEAKAYGTWDVNKTKYIRFLAGAELSPFYGTLLAGIGFAPLPPPFSFLEIRFIYENENIWSDVEMAMKPTDKPPIQETWDAGYIFDHFYNKSFYSQVQSFSTQLGGTYFGSSFDISFSFFFTLIDVNSDYDKKSFDYMRGIPLYSRDYVSGANYNILYKLNEGFAWSFKLSGMLSGRQLDFSSPFKKYDKEPLSYYLLSTGPLWKLGKNKSYVSSCLGLFNRSNSNNVFDDSFFNDSFAERILLSVEYKYFWNFEFGKQ